MRRNLGVLFVLLSISGLMNPSSAQETRPTGQQASGFQLGQNYPNPFNPETTIPFVLEEELFVEGRPVVVSMHIFNILVQEVAQPVALNHPAGPETPLVNLEYTTPGAFRAFWDGRDQNGRQVASGRYFLRLTVNGRALIRTMYVAK